jgi:hypothetical protein
MTAVVERPRGRVKDRDFEKTNEFHAKYAEYVNMYSDLQEEVTPGLVKAVLLLKPDFLQSPEWAAQQEARKAELAEKKAERERKAAEKAARDARYANLTDEQKKVLKKAERLARGAKAAQEEFAALLTPAE